MEGPLGDEYGRVGDRGGAANGLAGITFLRRPCTRASKLEWHAGAPCCRAPRAVSGLALWPPRRPCARNAFRRPSRRPVPSERSPGRRVLAGVHPTGFSIPCERARLGRPSRRRRADARGWPDVTQSKRVLARASVQLTACERLLLRCVDRRPASLTARVYQRTDSDVSTVHNDVRRRCDGGNDCLASERRNGTCEREIYSVYSAACSSRPLRR